MLKASAVSPVAGVLPKTLLALVTVTVSVPVLFTHVLTARSGRSDPTGTLCVVKGKIVPVVNDPVRPPTVMTGTQRANRGTLNVTDTVTVLLSHGYGELWRIFQAFCRL